MPTAVQKYESKAAAVESAERSKRALAKMRAFTQERGDEITGSLVSIIAGAGAGYWMGKRDDPTMKWFGLDPEIWLGGIPLALSFWLGGKRDRGSQMTASLMRNAGTGVLAAYGYGIAFDKAQSG